MGKENDKERHVQGRPVLITGGSGFVGGNATEFFEFDFFSPRSGEFDISYFEEVQDYFDRERPETVINFAAYTEVEGAERRGGDPSGRHFAHKINTMGAQNLAIAARESNAHLIHISTDFVFAGDRPKAKLYSENNIPFQTKGLGWYAETKRLGERLVREENKEAAIVRIAYPFGSFRSEKDYARKILNLIVNDIPVVSDQRITPTYIPDLANALKVIVDKKLSGNFHVATHPATTPFEFALYLAKKQGIDKNIREGSLADYLSQNPGKAPRPISGGLAVEKTQERLEISFKNWRKAVDEFIENYPPSTF